MMFEKYCGTIMEADDSINQENVAIPCENTESKKCTGCTSKPFLPYRATNRRSAVPPRTRFHRDEADLPIVRATRSRCPKKDRKKLEFLLKQEAHVELEFEDKFDVIEFSLQQLSGKYPEWDPIKLHFERVWEENNNEFVRRHSTDFLSSGDFSMNETTFNVGNPQNPDQFNNIQHHLLGEWIGDMVIHPLLQQVQASCLFPIQNIQNIQRKLNLIGHFLLSNFFPPIFFFFVFLKGPHSFAK